jgi:isoquinoline 1-oxidoreductase alpha subunit
MAYDLTVNGVHYSVNVTEDMPLLWVIRDVIGLTGTKYGCGIERCYACTILIDGEEKHSCVVTVKEGVGRKITTIEGLSPNSTHPLQASWLSHEVPQCGYCQSGQLMAYAARMKEDRLGTISNLCVCGTYQRIKEAAQAVKK